MTSDLTLTATVFTGGCGDGLWAEHGDRSVGTEQSDDGAGTIALFLYHGTTARGLTYCQTLETYGETLRFASHAEAVAAGAQWLGVTRIDPPAGWEG